jgi:septal ring factor EnvC (AmiA/AmiB activator)
MSNGSDLPDGFFGYVLAFVGTAMGTLVTTIATLWKVSEGKNAKAIEEQRQEIMTQKVEFADAKSQMRTEISMVRENLKAVEEARLECERDRAMLTAKCEIFESRLSKLEGHA